MVAAVDAASPRRLVGATKPAMQQDVRGRIVGTMLGLAIGDALGAPVEFRQRGSFPRVTGYDTVRSPRLPAGAFTDDTAMALCLTESLLFDPHLNERDLLTRFCRWRDHGEHTSTGVCVGIGQQTLRALADHDRTGALQATPRARGDGNGALMRVAPAAGRHWNDPERAVDVARRQSQTTHASSLSAACCARYVALLCALLQGHDWASARRFTPPGSDTTVIPDGWWTGLGADDVRGGGFVLETLQAAFFAVDSTTSFEDAVVVAVNLGDDADTVGAVAGALAGARYGEGAIPRPLRDGLVRGALVEDAAARLADAALADGPSAKGPP
jgi:ADP-ribosyl-[dinitrogen reductase] hydrolase